SEGRSYGTLYNSFHELEGDYEKLYKSTKGIKAWSVGPVSASANKGHNEDLAVDSELLNWLNSKPNDSVLYAITSFGLLEKKTEMEKETKTVFLKSLSKG
ncbi:soyasapogenol B glucuronide galactosyltransferase-like, partial [Trifolium medium]|nr:soyasapogenol B glucuronide galactosyltransferase-like [Trifolium medium]